MLAHRREIIAQTSQKLFAAGIAHGIIQAGFQPRPLERGAGRIGPDVAPRAAISNETIELPPADLLIDRRGAPLPGDQLSARSSTLSRRHRCSA